MSLLTAGKLDFSSYLTSSEGSKQCIAIGDCWFHFTGAKQNGDEVSFVIEDVKATGITIEISVTISAKIKHRGLSTEKYDHDIFDVKIESNLNGKKQVIFENAYRRISTILDMKNQKEKDANMSTLRLLHRYIEMKNNFFKFMPINSVKEDDHNSLHAPAPHSYQATLSPPQSKNFHARESAGFAEITYKDIGTTGPASHKTQVLKLRTSHPHAIRNGNEYRNSDAFAGCNTIITRLYVFCFARSINQ